MALERGDVMKMDQYAGIPGVVEKNLKSACSCRLPELGEHRGLQLLDGPALGGGGLRRDRELVGAGDVTSLVLLND